MASFVYKDIDIERRDFRLLRLHKGGGTIQCTLDHAQLPDDTPQSDDKPLYEALSYTWGPLEMSASLMVNGKEIKITENLCLALQYLRQQDCDRILWVDAICINQNNMEERGHQVKHMGDIYKHAVRVVIWLGPATYKTNVVMDSLLLLAKENDVHPSEHLETVPQRWKDCWMQNQPLLSALHPGLEILQREGIKLLLGKPWFKRVWILQEVANAQEALVCCGTRSVPAHIFTLAPSLMDIRPEPHCDAVLKLMPGLDHNDRLWGKELSLYTLILRFKGSEASDPRDMIFALLGMSKDAKNSEVVCADYTKGIKEIISDAASFMFDLGHTDHSTMDDFLHNLAIMNEQSFCEAACGGDAKSIAEFLKRRGNDVQVTENVLVAALKNKKSPNEVLEVVLKQRGHRFRVSIKVLKLAAEHQSHGLKLVRLLLQQQGCELEVPPDVLEAVTQNHSEGDAIVQLLLEQRGFPAETRADILELAAQYWRDWKLIRDHLDKEQQHGRQVEITEALLIAAASNQYSGDKLMAFLLQRQSQVRITGGIITAAVQNQRNGISIMKVISDLRTDELKTALTISMVEAAAKSWGLEATMVITKLFGQLESRGTKRHWAP